MNQRNSKVFIDIRKEIGEADKPIRNYIRRTPLEYSYVLSRLGKCQVYLKLENYQITGSFKIRGAANKILSLLLENGTVEVMTSSTGNHGAAVAYMLKQTGCHGTIYVPKNSAGIKIESLRSYGANVVFYGNDCVETELFARKIAGENDAVYISPYNDLKVIGGQGTVGLEITEQIKFFHDVHHVDAVLVPVGGGGLISGIGVYLKSIEPSIEIIGCQPDNSAVMHRSLCVGNIVDMESLPTVSDGTAGGIEPGSMTFDICREVIDDFILVSESELKNAIFFMLDKHQMIIEGSAALSVASFLKKKEGFKNKTVVLIITGNKIGADRLASIITEFEGCG